MQSAEAIAKELQRHLKGAVHGDELYRYMYSSDASIFKVVPLCVAMPRDAEDVLAAIDYARREGLPIIARGAGSSRCGQPLGEAIILDLGVHLNQVLEINPDQGYVRVQPGVVLADLNRALKPSGKFFAPDPSSGDWCTLGGMIANNASGAHTGKYGTTKRHVLALDAVLANGQAFRTQRLAWDGPELARLRAERSREGEIYRGVAALLEAHQVRLQARRPQVRKDVCGYNLYEVRENGAFDLSQLLVGSEGTLAVVTEAMLRILDLPKAKALALVTFDRLEAVGPAVCQLLEWGASMMEFVEATLLAIARKGDPALDAFLPRDLECALIVEFDGADRGEVEEQLHRMERVLVRELGLASAVKPAPTPGDQDRLIKMRKAAASILNKIEGPRKPLAFIEDATVPPARLGEYLDALRATLKRHETEVFIYGHAGDGNLHVIPLLNLKEASEVRRMRAIAEEVHDLVLALGGSISGEHGDGLARTPYVRRQWGDLYPLLEQVKVLFDPEGLLNPGKIVGQDPDLLVKNLRYGMEYRRISTGTPLDDERWQREIELCHGCGTCRTYCPVSLELVEEPTTARPKANLLRGLISGELPLHWLTSPAFKAVMDYCVNCKLCLTRCPTNVDIPGMALLARTHYVQQKGLEVDDWVLGRSELAGTLGTLTAPLSNLGNRLAPVRWLMEKVVGIDRRRELPVFARPAFKKNQRLGRRGAARRVAYFPGCYATFNDPDGEARATVEVLERNGHEVLVPDWRCCGVAMITKGGVDAIRRDIDHNVRTLATLVRQGYNVVASAASCGLTLKHDYPELLKSEEARLVAAHTFDIHEYLVKLRREGALATAFRPMNLRVVYHNACHMEAQGIGREVIELLQLIPGLTIVPIADGCCGIAGTFGMKCRGFELSMRIGGHLFDELKRAKADVSLTSCGTCKLQMEQGTAQTVLHTVRLLQQAYDTRERSRSSDTP